MKYVRNSGGPLPKAIGDMLASRGVNLYQGWGSTEIGPVTITVQKEPYGLDWDWIELQANTHPILEPQDDEGKVYELIMKVCSLLPIVCTDRLQGTRTHLLAMLTDKEQDLYHTNDLVEKHPTKPGLIRIVGRKDDQIMLSTGQLLSLDAHYMYLWKRRRENQPRATRKHHSRQSTGQSLRVLWSRSLSEWCSRRATSWCLC
jgi:acyl-coenzyme A synthetase/AMP-(fatty) acid ligase